MTARRAESDVEMLARLNRDLADLRRVALARMVSARRLAVPVFQGQQANMQSIGGSLTAIVLDADPPLDTHGGHSLTAAPARWTCPTGWGGIYCVSGRVRIATVAVGAVITCSVGRNGVNLPYAQVDAFGDSLSFGAATGAVYVQLAEGDYVELLAAQSVGSSRNTVAGFCALGVAFVRR